MFNDLSEVKAILRYFACFVALGFGTGLLQAIPGTLATLLVGIPLYQLLSGLPTFYYSVILLLSFILGIVVCTTAEEVLASPDDPAIVWDEICGYLLTMINAPSGFFWTLLGFFLFRLFDIWKPWPINIVEQRVKGGLGIMLDDTLAAIYAGLILYFFTYLL